MKTKYINIYMGIIGAIAIIYGSNVHAMRCGNFLLEIGNPEFLVEQACGAPLSRHVVINNVNSHGDEVYLYYRIGEHMIEELDFVDGHLVAINDINA